VTNSGFPVVLELDPAGRRHEAIKYGSLLAALNLFVIVGLLNLLEIFPKGPDWGRAARGLARLAAPILLGDLALAGALVRSVFSRVEIHWDRLELIAAGRRRVVYFFEVDRVDFVPHKQKSPCALALAGGRSLVLPRAFVPWQVLEPILKQTAFAVLAFADPAVRRRMVLRALPVVLQKDWAPIVAEAIIYPPLLLIVDLVVISLSTALAAIMLGRGGLLGTNLVMLTSLVVVLTLNVRGIRRWRRRSFTVVRVDAERLEVCFRRSKREIRFADVANIEMVKLAGRRYCRFVGESGTRFLVDAYAASFAHLYPFLRDTLLLKLAADVDGQLRRGSSITLRETDWQGKRRRRPNAPPRVPTEYMLDDRKAAALVDRRARALRGGFTITAAGLRQPSDHDDVTPWSEVMDMEADEAGVLISTDAGKYFMASVDAENYLPAVTWLVTQRAVA
jgi:hypothetical protein